MDINLIIKVLILIVVIGLSLKAVRAITGLIFKAALVGLVLLFIYKLFI